MFDDEFDSLTSTEFASLVLGLLAKMIISFILVSFSCNRRITNSLLSLADNSGALKI